MSSEDPALEQSTVRTFKAQKDKTKWSKAQGAVLTIDTTFLSFSLYVTCLKYVFEFRQFEGAIPKGKT